MLQLCQQFFNLRVQKEPEASRIESIWYTSMIFIQAYELLLYTNCYLDEKLPYAISYTVVYTWLLYYYSIGRSAPLLVYKKPFVSGPNWQTSAAPKVNSLFKLSIQKEIGVSRMQSIWYISMIFTHACELLVYTSCSFNEKLPYTISHTVVYTLLLYCFSIQRYAPFTSIQKAIHLRP